MSSKVEKKVWLPRKEWLALQKSQKAAPPLLVGVKKPKKQVKQVTTKMWKSPTANSVVLLSGAHGTDSRSPKNFVKKYGEGDIVVKQQDPTINATVPITRRSLAYLAMGVVLRAMKHGWLGSNTGQVKLPYYAFRYLIDTFTQALSGSFPLLQTAPLWLWELCAALQPKTESFKTGKVVYTPILQEDGEGTDPAFHLGTLDESYTVFWGVVDGIPPVNDFPVLVAPPAYDFATNGTASIQAMFEFFPNEGLNRRLGPPDPDKLMMTHDTSAFCAVYSNLGSSFFNPCGVAQEVYSERPIHSPIFAKFSSYQSADDEPYWRGHHQMRKSAGTPSYLGTRISEMGSGTELHNKCMPVFKLINFDEIYEVLSLAICMAREKMAEGGSAAINPCPLTVQQVQIILRQTLLAQCNNEMAQDMRIGNNLPFASSFLPMVVGPNGISTGPTGMVLPLILAENIRCLARTTSRLENSKDPTGSLVLDMVPILVRPNLPQLGNYKWGGGDNLIYTEDVDEVPIRLIDCSYDDGGSTRYVSLAGPAIEILVSEWNNWVQGLSGCLAELVAIDAEMGPSILSSLIYTDCQRQLGNPGLAPAEPPANTGQEKTVEKDKKNSPSSATPKLDRKSSKKRLEGNHPLSKFRHRVGASPENVTSSYFDKWVNIQINSQLGFATPIYKYIHNFILPAVTPANNSTETCIAALQSNAMEPYSVAASANFAFNQQIAGNQFSFPYVYDKHFSFASMNVKAYNSPTANEYELELKTLGAQGRGGWLGDLAGKVLDGVGLPVWGKVARGVGNLTGL